VYPDEFKPAVSFEYGHYLATTCSGCHGQNFKGGPAHGANQPAIPDISSSGRAGKWKDDQFIHTMRTGMTPEGKQLSNAMPWRDFTYTDDELKAISLYLHKLK
jgi:cytochrome c553